MSRKIPNTHEKVDTTKNAKDGRVKVSLTGDDCDECIKVTIYGVNHYIHAFTARELSNQLLEALDTFNKEVKGANKYMGYDLLVSA